MLRALPNTTESWKKKIKDFWKRLKDFSSFLANCCLMQLKHKHCLIFLLFPTLHQIEKEALKYVCAQSFELRTATRQTITKKKNTENYKTRDI